MAIGCQPPIKSKSTGLKGSATAAKDKPSTLDFVIMPKGSELIDQIPSFLVGSSKFDNWIILNALRDPEITVIDVTAPKFRQGEAVYSTSDRQSDMAGKSG